MHPRLTTRKSMKKRKLLITLAAATVLASGAQINSPAPAGYIARGHAMFADDNYIGTIQQLRHAAASRDLSDAEREELQYLEAMSAFHTGDSEALGMLRRWLVDWPASTRRADVLMSVGDCLFTTNYAEALAVYERVQPEALANADRREDLLYRTAYCLLKVADYDRALPILKQLEASSQYGNAARFYQAYIAYARGDYNSAKQLFATVNTATQPGCMADYYLSQIYFMEGNYDRALSLSRSLLQRRGIEPAFQAEANRIAGESLFQLERPDEAVPFLKKYVSMTETPLTSALYILGLSQYGSGDYEGAVATLRPVTDDDSAMGQNAYLYIGQALLKTGDTDGAIMSFDRALRMPHDSRAAENAFYNYAVAKYAGGKVPFGSSVTTFEEFLTRYPDSKHADEVRQYIITGYLTDNNYEAALASINRAKHPSAAVLAAKQRVLYTLGTRDLASGNAQSAVTRLKEAKSLASHNADYARETHLSLGEALYRTGDYTGAVSELKAYLANTRGATAQNIAVAHFDLGYAYMAQKKWADAATQFADVTAHPASLNATMVADAYNRLGDCHYYMKEWAKASDAYDHAYETLPSAGDYALFQKAMMDGYTGNFTAKLIGMQQLAKEFPTSAMLPDAMLEMTEAQLRTGDTDSAIVTWKKLIANYPGTAQGRQAYLQMALTYTDKGRDAEAEKAYREIISLYPTSDEAAQAAEVLKRDAAAKGTLDNYIEFINTVDNAPRIDATEAERLMYNAGLQAADEKNDYTRLKDYIGRYPSGKYAATAYGMLLENAYDAKDFATAATYADALISRWPDNGATELAYLCRASQYEEQGRGQEALNDWTALAQRASTPATANRARLGVMRTARTLSRPAEMESAARALLTSTALGTGEKTEATFTLGLARQLNGDRAGAIEIWKEIAPLTDTEYGSKAAVYMAQAQLDNGNAEQARATAEKFTSSDTPHTYWLARGFIVLSDALRAQGKDYEANEYLQAVRDNYPGTEADIFSMIEERLK